MPDNADLIEQYELELWNIVYRMHRDGIRFAVTHGILQELVKTLDIQGYCEDWLNQYNRGDKK